MKKYVQERQERALGAYGAILEARETFEKERTEWQNAQAPKLSAERASMVERLHKLYERGWGGCAASGQTPFLTGSEAELILRTIGELERT